LSFVWNIPKLIGLRRGVCRQSISDLGLAI
jgi:hypothetical protein